MVSSSRPLRSRSEAPVAVRPLARAISRLERGEASLEQSLQALGLQPAEAYAVGVTGPPGAGKSTLVDRLIELARADGQRVAVIAVDPSSPYSGGALLGDRVRMMRHHADPNVFIRSMAARRAPGGLATATRDVGRLLSAAGFDLVILETVGVGQGELDVMQAADSVVVVAVPGLGDSVQMLKAGLLEIADLFVVNMADRPDAARTAAELRSLEMLAASRADWSPPVLLTVASEGQGVQAVWDALGEHRRYLAGGGILEGRRRQQRRSEGVGLIERLARERLLARLAADPGLQALLDDAAEGRLEPAAAADRILSALFGPAEPAAGGRAEPD